MTKSTFLQDEIKRLNDELARVQSTASARIEHLQSSLDESELRAKRALEQSAHHYDLLIEAQQANRKCNEALQTATDAAKYYKEKWYYWKNRSKECMERADKAEAEIEKIKADWSQNGFDGNEG